MPNGGEHYEDAGLCPHCNSPRIRIRRGRHREMLWRCRSCNKVFRTPSIGTLHFQGPESNFVFPSQILRLENRVRRRSGGGRRTRRGAPRSGVVIVAMLIILAMLAGGGYWLFGSNDDSAIGGITTSLPTPTLALIPTTKLEPTLAPVEIATTNIPTRTAEADTGASAIVPGNGRFDGRAVEEEVHRLINSERVKRGLAELNWDDQVATIARAHSEDMAANDYFRHDNLEGESPTDRGNRGGYPCRKALGGGSFSYGLAENIWMGWEFSSFTYGLGGTRYDWMSQTQLAKQAVSSWMDSPGHRENILAPEYNAAGVGIGFGIADGKEHAVYLTQNFC